MTSCIYITFVLFLTGCATSQWIFNHAEDKTFNATEKVEDINSVALTHEYLRLKISTALISSQFQERSEKIICLDRIGFTPAINANETIIT